MQLAEVGAATKFLKPLPLLPLPWLTETATATSATFSKLRNRYSQLRYSATATTTYIKGGKRGGIGGHHFVLQSPNFMFA